MCLCGFTLGMSISCSLFSFLLSLLLNLNGLNSSMASALHNIVTSELDGLIAYLSNHPDFDICCQVSFAQLAHPGRKSTD